MSEWDYNKINDYVNNIKDRSFQRKMDAFLNSGTPEQNEKIQNMFFGGHPEWYKKKEPESNTAKPVDESEEVRWFFEDCPNCHKTIRFKSTAGTIIVKCPNCTKKIKFTIK